MGIDQDTRMGEVFGTAGVLALCAGLYYHPMITAFVAIAVFAVWVFADS
jgi:hypothetical protein